MKICLVGSTRFRERFYELNHGLTIAGHCVYTVAFFMRDSQGEPLGEITDEEKELLDLVHLRKIQESEAVVLVTDDTGYFGDSTRRELLWAELNGKAIFTARADIECLCEPPMRVYDL